MIVGIIVLLPATANTQPTAFNPISGDFDFVNDISNTIPSSIFTACSPPQMAYDNSYWYVCTDTDTWRRTALSSWVITDVILMSGGTDKILMSDGSSNILIRP